jgi:hypothetical protein
MNVNDGTKMVEFFGKSFAIIERLSAAVPELAVTTLFCSEPIVVEIRLSRHLTNGPKFE